MRDYAIRTYGPGDEKQWVRCRTLAFLDSAYFDNVLVAKERYEHPAIELVAVVDDTVIGLMDVELEDVAGGIDASNDRGVSAQNSAGTVAREIERCRRMGTIWHVAVHPDWRRQGIATALLDEAKSRAVALGVTHLEAWTRDDQFVRDWYLAKGFAPMESYLHVWADGRDELKGTIKSEIPGLMPCLTFAHYVGDDREAIKKRFARVHECVRYEMRILGDGA